MARCEQNINIQRNLIRNRDIRIGLYLKYPKTEDSTRTLALSDNVIELLKKHQEEQNELITEQRSLYQNERFIFCNDDGSNIDSSVEQNKK